MPPMIINNLRIGLEGYELLRIEEKHDLRVHVELARVREPKACPYCGAHGLRSKGVYVRRARHLSCFGHDSELIIRTRRLKCTCCNRSFIPDLPGLRPYRQSSEPFRNHIYQQHNDGICASALSRNQTISQATVGRIYQQFTIRKASERISLNCPLYLGIDEHTLHKGQRFCTTFCDLKNHKVFEVHPGKSEEELAGFLATLKGRERLRLVCIDLSSPYRRLVRKWFPRAKIVADRFHAVRLVYQHCVQMMRAIAPQIRNKRGTLAALRKAPEKLTPEQTSRRDQLFNTYPAIKAIYEQMHLLRRLMKHKKQNKQQCKRHAKALLEHIHRLKYSGLAPLQTLARSLKQWIEPIALMWRFSKNNAITEGFHRKMKLIQRRAYGFRNFNNYRLRVVALCG